MIIVAASFVLISAVLSLSVIVILVYPHIKLRMLFADKYTTEQDIVNFVRKHYLLLSYRWMPLFNDDEMDIYRARQWWFVFQHVKAWKEHRETRRPHWKKQLKRQGN